MNRRGILKGNLKTTYAELYENEKQHIKTYSKSTTEREIYSARYLH